LSATAEPKQGRLLNFTSVARTREIRPQIRLFSQLTHTGGVHRDTPMRGPARDKHAASMAHRDYHKP
jgi:hypothetical protein